MDRSGGRRAGRHRRTRHGVLKARRVQWFFRLFNNADLPAERMDAMTKETTKTLANMFSHVREGDTKYESGGLRDFFLYRDLGIAAATGGQVIAQLVKANQAPEVGTGWHRHEANFHIVFMLKGWARFMYEDKPTLVKAGDCVHQRPGIVHF